MRIRFATITGADDHVLPDELASVSRAWRHVEWGVLCSQTREGTARFPLREWLHYLPEGLRLSAHICGRYMRDLKNGLRSWQSDYVNLSRKFQRAQINLGRELLSLGQIDELGKLVSQNGIRWIIPEAGANANIDRKIKLYGCIDVLLDHSGGTGKLGEWTIPSADGFIGFSGGLNPDNLRDELQKIEDLVGERDIWIDVESGVRTDDRLDLDKVDKFLSIASEYFV